MENPWKTRKLWIKPPSDLVINDFQRLFAIPNTNSLTCFTQVSSDYFAVLLKPDMACKEAMLDALFLGKWRFCQMPTEKKDKQSLKCDKYEYLEIQKSWYNLSYVQRAAEILGSEPYLFISEDDEFRPLLLASEEDERRGAIGIVNSKRRLCYTAVSLDDIAISVFPADLHLQIEQIARLRNWLDIPEPKLAYADSFSPLHQPRETDCKLQHASAHPKTSELAQKCLRLTQERIHALTQYAVQYSK